MRPIDSRHYPHIIDAIFTAADHETLAALRTTCKLFKERSDALFVRHICITWCNDRICFLARDYSDPDSETILVPPLRPPFTTPWKPIPYFAPFIRIVDLSDKLGHHETPEWVFSLPNVQTVRQKWANGGSRAEKDGQFEEHESLDKGGQQDESNEQDASDTTVIPQCDVYITRMFLPFFDINRPFSIRDGGRIVIVLDDPEVEFVDFSEGDMLLECASWLEKFTTWDGEVVLYFQPDNQADFDEDLFSDPYVDEAMAVRTVKGIATDVALGLATLRDNPVGPKFTFVDLDVWLQYYQTADSGLGAWMEGFLKEHLNAHYGDGASLKELLELVRFQTVGQYLGPDWRKADY